MQATRISLCTVCMNRLFTLKETLPYNIEHSKQYPNVEMALLDYNSSDGLEDWIKQHCTKYISSGLLNYYKLISPEINFFSHPHSRNILFRLTTGSILCNVNADYYTGPGFLEYVNDTLSPGIPLALISDVEKSTKDNLGRICMRKIDYLQVGGFDETFKGYGYEDTDLSLRLKMAGVRLAILPDTFYNVYISHEDTRRMENMYDSHQVQRAFVRKIDGSKSNVLFLYKDHSAQKGTLLRSKHDIPTIEEGGWLKGSWEQMGKNICLRGFSQNELLLREEVAEDIPQLVYEEECYREVREENAFKKLIFYKSKIHNYQLMRNRSKSGNYVANANGFGKGVVIKNFYEKIILD